MCIVVCDVPGGEEFGIEVPRSELEPPGTVI